MKQPAQQPSGEAGAAFVVGAGVPDVPEATVRPGSGAVIGESVGEGDVAVAGRSPMVNVLVPRTS